MKTLCFIGLMFLTTIPSRLIAQNNSSVGIGTSSPNNSAALDVQHNRKGVLVPRMTKENRDNIVAPANGLMIYQTDSSAGFYVNKGNMTAPKWKPVNGSAQAFTAYLSASQTFTGAATIVQYTTTTPPAGETLLNDGEIFADSALARFTATEEGLYYLEAGISWNTDLLSNTQFYFSTFPNNAILPAQHIIYLDPDGTGSYNKVYGIFWFKKGDKYRVRCSISLTATPGRTNYFRVQKID